MLSSILPSNQQRFQMVVDKILRQGHRTIAVLGMSFKKNSADLRDSLFIALIERLLQEGIAIRIFDPDVRIENVTGECLQRFGYLLPMLKDELAAALAGCDGVVIGKDLLDEHEVRRLMSSGIPLYDLGYFLKLDADRENKS